MKLLSWLASGTGIIGALILALNLGVNYVAYVIFTTSSILWIFYAVKTSQYSLLSMNFVFTCINILGFVNYV